MLWIQNVCELDFDYYPAIVSSVHETGRNI